MTIKKVSGGEIVVSHTGKRLTKPKSHEGAVKDLRRIEWFKEHAKCIVDPSLVKDMGTGGEWPSDGNITIYQPITFRTTKPKDKAGEKVDFPSTTKQLELKDVKQPEFPSTPFTGEAYSQSFHNPRPSNSVKDETHVIVQGDTPAAQGAGPFRGEHGPDVQFKGSDYVPDHVKQKARAANARKSITIAGRKVIIKKATQGSDNENLRGYPIDKGKGEPLNQYDESQKRKDWVRSKKVKEDVKAHEDAKKNYAPGNGPFGLAMNTKTAYLGRSKDGDLNKNYGKFMDDKGSMKILSDKEIKAKQKSDKDIASPKPVTRKIREFTKKSAKGIMRVILQYTQNQPLAAGFKPLLAHLVKEEDDDEENLKGPKLAAKAMTSSEVYDRISRTRDKNKPVSPKLQRLGSRAAKEGESSDTQTHDEGAPIHPGVDYKALNRKSDRPNPFPGGKGDDLEYDDVDQQELEAGIEVEQEHVGNDPNDDEDEKRVKGADIAMDHLAEDEHYYTKLKEMERSGKEGAKAETKKQKLLKLGSATKSTKVVNLADYRKKLEQKKGDFPRPYSVTKAEAEIKKEKND